MTRNFFIQISIACLLLTTGCSLDLVPPNDLSDEVFWQTDRDFQQATNYLYRKIYLPDNNHQSYPIGMDLMSDNAVANPVDNISNGSYLPSSDFGPWGRDYGIIRDANNVMEHVTSFTGPNAKRYMAEAKFFRAYAYHELVSRYGDVPLVLKTLDTDSKELYAPRNPRSEVVAQIYKDLDEAAADLPLNSQLNMGTDYGRVTRGAALAFKSRVALREGTWNKFHQAGDYIFHLQTAKDAALAVMNSREYGLFTKFGTESFKMLFKLAGEGPSNKEPIWVYPYGPDDPALTIRNNYFQSFASQGDFAFTRSLVVDFLCIDGLPIDQSPLYQGEVSSESVFINRDLRLSGTVVKKGDPFRGGVPYIPTLTARTGYMMYKYFDSVGAGMVSGTVDFQFIRYGEVLLNYAEATYELTNSITDADLNLSINLLRDRAGVAHLTNGFVADHNLNMQREIRRERRVELALEGFRYDDLLRWKIAEVELPKPLLGVKFINGEYGNVSASNLNLTPEGYIIVEPASQRSFDASKHYLWPLPLNQLAMNPNLTQNPNWK